MINGQENITKPTLQQSDEIDLRPLLYRFMRNWYWIALSALFFGGLGWTYLRYTTPIYKVEGSLLIRSDKKSGLSQEDIVFSELGFNSGSNLDNELQILKSYPVISQVIDSLDLGVSYFAQGRVKTTELYKDAPITVSLLKTPENLIPQEDVSFQFNEIDDTSFRLLTAQEDSIIARYNIPFNLGDSTLLIEKLAAVDQPLEIVFANKRKLIQDYLKKLRIKPVEDSDVLSISLTDPSPEKAGDFIQKLITFYNKTVVDDKKIVAENTLDFIDERLIFIKRELFDVEKEVEIYKNRNEVPMELGNSASHYLDEISASDKAIAEMKFQKTFVDNLKEYVDKKENEFKFLSSLPDIGEGSGFSASINQYNELITKREKLLLAANPANPQVVSLEGQIISLRSSVVNSLNQITADLQNRIGQLESKVKPVIQRMNRIPTNQRELVQIMRQQQIKESLFLYLLQKREETGLTLAAQIADTRIINPPTNLGKISPNKTIVMIGSIIAGLFLVVMLLTLLEVFRNTILDEEDIKRHTNVPFLGAIAKSKENYGQIVVKKGSRSALAEMFRLLRTNIDFLNTSKNKESSVILVTSSQSGEGKTFVSLNLGASIALSGKKTLLLGFDLRKPKLAKYIGGTINPKGISNFLAGMEDDLNQLIQPLGDYGNLFFLGSGPTPPNPADMILTQRTALLFERLLEQFDVLVVDSPPVGMVTDALLLGKYVDLTLYVTRQGVTHKGQLKIVEDIYANKKLPRPALVLNGVKAGKGYGTGYGYGYGYGEGYYEEDQPEQNGKHHPTMKESVQID